jgi:hypothetical protein
LENNSVYERDLVTAVRQFGRMREVGNGAA